MTWYVLIVLTIVGVIVGEHYWKLYATKTADDTSPIQGKPIVDIKAWWQQSGLRLLLTRPPPKLRVRANTSLWNVETVKELYTPHQQVEELLSRKIGSSLSQEEIAKEIDDIDANLKWHSENSIDKDLETTYKMYMVKTKMLEEKIRLAQEKPKVKRKRKTTAK